MFFKIILAVTLIFSFSFALEINISEHSEIDNVGYMRSFSSLSLNKLNTGIGEFGVYSTFNYGEFDNNLSYINNFSTKILDISTSWTKKFGDLYLFAGASLNDLSDISNSIGYSGTLAYSFSNKIGSVVKFGYKKDFYTDNSTTMFYKINFNGFKGEYKYKAGRNQLNIFTRYSFIDGLDTNTLIPSVDSVPINRIFDSYLLYMKKVNKQGTFVIGGVASYATSQNSFNREVITDNKPINIYYPYYTPINKVTAELLLMKTLVVKNRIWITFKTQLPIFSMEDQIVGGGLGSSIVYTIYGTQDFKLGTSVVFPIMNKFKVDFSYEFTQKPYTTYGYLDFNNSYINNIFKFNFLWNL